MALPLAYNTNLHPTETVGELVATLDDFSAQVRAGLGWERLGLDLRLGSRAIAACRRAKERDKLRACLDRNRLVPYTFNAFPLSPFQVEIVKEQAYEPDWTTAKRLDDSVACIDLALAFCDEDFITISTLPGSFKPWGPRHNDRARIARAYGHWCGQAARRHADTGRTVMLCIEPEPWCTFEFSQEIAAFWTIEMAEAGLDACAELLDGDETAAQAALERHLGICFDTCHVSVAFEDQAAAAERLADCGATPAKVQFSACPEVRDPRHNEDGLHSLAAMDEVRFLHQTAARDDIGTRQVPDLDRLEELLEDMPEAQCVRSHFHIPVDKQPTAPGLSSTVADSLVGLQACLRHGARHIAVETYTWSLFAAQGLDPIRGTIEEMTWLREQLDDLSSAN